MSWECIVVSGTPPPRKFKAVPSDGEGMLIFWVVEEINLVHYVRVTGNYSQNWFLKLHKDVLLPQDNNICVEKVRN